MGNLVITLAWLVVLAESFGVVLIGPFILMVIPFTFAAGVSLISAAHEWAEREWTCDACGKLIELEPATHAPAAAPELHPARAA